MFQGQETRNLDKRIEPRVVAGTGIDCHGRRLFTKQQHDLVPGSLPPAIDHSSNAKEEGGNFLHLLDNNVVGVIKRTVKQNTILSNAATSH